MQDYLRYIVEEIHSTVFATVDREGRPVTCAIDMMDYDGSGLYFLTARGKNFYERLKENENVAFTAMKGEDTLSCVAVSVRGCERRGLFRDGAVHRLQALLFALPVEVHRYNVHAGRDTPGALHPLRQLLRGVPGAGDREEIGHDAVRAAR